MTNFYRDNKDMLFHMKNMDIKRIIDLKENDFKKNPNDKNNTPEAPQDYADALDNYDRVLEIVGDICGNYIAPRAPQVDLEGATFKDGKVTYAKGTAEAIERLKKADLFGFTIPREYGGLNMPKIVYSMAIEMVSRADASLMNIFGLQDIADTIFKFGSEEQKENYLPRFCTGEVMGSMALTEPDAGSDLQAAMLKAYQDDAGQWRLNGVKRFITNGLAEISLVMARSEDGSTDGRGISLFVYEREANMMIRRIEHKLGIHGSPTCELQFNHAPAELLGRRKFGLIKYTMSLMNGARLGIAAQSLGIAEAAYAEADNYARKRIQFKSVIFKFAPVYEMLTDMRVTLEGMRTLLYETSRIVDIKEGLEEKGEKHPELAQDLKTETSRYTKLAGLYTPIAKYFNTEWGNKICYDALQIHGGVGYTTEFNIERHCRDVRITNIYEGTTQLQVVAAIGGITSGLIFERLNEYESMHQIDSLEKTFQQIKEMRNTLELAVAIVKKADSAEVLDFQAGRLVNMTSDIIVSYLLCIDALKSDRKKKVAEIFISKAITRVKANFEFIERKDYTIIENHKNILNEHD